MNGSTWAVLLLSSVLLILICLTDCSTYLLYVDNTGFCSAVWTTDSRCVPQLLYFACGKSASILSDIKKHLSPGSTTASQWYLPRYTMVLMCYDFSCVQQLWTTSVLVQVLLLYEGMIYFYTRICFLRCSTRKM